MKTKQPKRYNTANDIRDAVDRFKLKAQKYRDSASAIDKVADEIAKQDGASERWKMETISMKRAQADKLRIQAGRIEQRTLEKLKGKLAEFNTNPMPFLEGDRSIPVKG